MTWNYRLIRRLHRTGPGHGVTPRSYTTVGIYEVYYRKNTKGKLAPYACTAGPICMMSDQVAEIKEQYKMMAEAFRAPVLKWSDIPTDRK